MRSVLLIPISRHFPIRLRHLTAFILVGILTSGIALAGDKDEHEHGYLGIALERITKSFRTALDLKGDDGVLIAEVFEDSPAEEAGLEDGDVIVRFDGQAIDSPGELQGRVRKTEPGEKIKVRVIRKGKVKNINVVVGEAPEDIRLRGWLGDHWRDRREFDFDGISGDVHRFMLAPGGLLGVRVTELNEELAPYFKVEAGGGVLVVAVTPQSVAEQAGITAGDVIVQLGAEGIASVDDLRRAARALDDHEAFTLSIVRQGKARELSAEMVFSNYSGHRSAGSFLREFHLPGAVWLPQHIEDDVREDMEELKEELNELRQQLDQLRGS